MGILYTLGCVLCLLLLIACVHNILSFLLYLFCKFEDILSFFFIPLYSLISKLHRFYLSGEIWYFYQSFFNDFFNNAYPIEGNTFGSVCYNKTISIFYSKFTD